jgi:hypothetical protein
MAAGARQDQRPIIYTVEQQLIRLNMGVTPILPIPTKWMIAIVNGEWLFFQ